MSASDGKKRDQADAPDDDALVLLHVKEVSVGAVGQGIDVRRHGMAGAGIVLRRVRCEMVKW